MAMRQISIAVAALLCALSASAAIRIEPAAPDETSAIRITAFTMICVPVANVSVEGSVVTITLSLAPGVLCNPFEGEPMPLVVSVPVDIGRLPAGVYTVKVVNGLTFPDETALVVRGVGPLGVVPYGGPTSGFTKAYIQMPAFYFDFVAGVKFAGQDVTMTDFPLVTVPPHAAGSVDVTVTFMRFDRTTYDRTVSSAYRYFDPAAAPDPALFEPLLFPIAYEGAGAYGSLWTTDNVFSPPAWTTPVWFFKAPCSACSTMIAGNSLQMGRLDKASNPAGTLIFVDRGTADFLSPASRIRDTTRDASTAGTEIPVVRERDFKPQVILQNIPLDGRYRVMLRAWSLDEIPHGLQVHIYKMTSSSTPVGTNTYLSFTRVSPDSLPFASVDLTPLLRGLGTGSTATVTFGSRPIAGANQPFVNGEPFRLWGMVSITNNDTQQVTIIAPH